MKKSPFKIYLFGFVVIILKLKYLLMKKFIFTIIIVHCARVALLAPLLIPSTRDCLSQTPTEEWVARWGQPYLYSTLGKSVKSDSIGNIYVLADTLWGFGFVKYSASGALILSAQHWLTGGPYTSGSGDFFDISPAGDVYITGKVSVNFDNWIYTIKFNTNGIFQWGKLYNFDNNDTPFDIKVDRADNIIVVGSSLIGSSSYALFLKYKPNGDTIWTRHYNYSQQRVGNRKAVLDGMNNIFTTGVIGALPGKSLISKCDSSGNSIWFTTFTLDQLRSNIGSGINIDSFGNVYVIGTQVRPQGQFDTYLLKLRSNGDTLWNKAYPNYAPGEILGPVVSSNGNAIYYTETIYAPIGSDLDIATLKYDSLGVQKWVNIFNGGVQGGYDKPTGIRKDKFDNIYVCGTGYYQTTNGDFITLKYLPAGTQQWVARYTGLVTNGGDGAKGLFIDTSLNVYVTGLSRKLTSSEFDAVTIKYNQPIGIAINNNGLPDEYKLFQNYPNPFNSITVINYTLPKTCDVKLTLFNIIGEEVKTLVNNKQNAGYYTIAVNMENYSSGVYFYSMTANGNIVETKKLILIK